MSFGRRNLPLRCSRPPTFPLARKIKRNQTIKRARGIARQGADRVAVRPEFASDNSGSRRRLSSRETATVWAVPRKSEFGRLVKEMNFLSAHQSSNPICPANQCGLCGGISGCVRTDAISVARDSLTRAAISKRYRRTRAKAGRAGLLPWRRARRFIPLSRSLHNVIPTHIAVRKCAIALDCGDGHHPPGTRFGKPCRIGGQRDPFGNFG
jgi:hypothetical protein